MTLLKHNIIANFLGQGWAALMGLAFIPSYIGYLGIEAYGLIGLFAVLQVWLGLLDMGISPTLGREMARFSAGVHTPQSIRDLLRTLEVIVFVLSILVIILLWYSADWLANDWLKIGKIKNEEVARALAIASIVIGLRFFESLYRSAIFGLQRQVWFNVAHASLSTIRYAGAIGVLLLISPTIDAFFTWNAIISLIAVIIYGYKLHRLLPKASIPARFSCTAITRVLRFAGGVLGINVLAVLLTQVDKVLLSRLLSLENFGYYTLSATVAGGLYLLISPITQALYPQLVEHSTQKNNRLLAKVYHHGAQLVTLAVSPIMPILFIHPEGAIYLWSGDPALVANAATLLTPLILGSFLNGLMWMPYQCQLANGWTSLGLKVNIAAVCILVPSIILFVPHFGAISAAWLWVALNVGYVLIPLHYMHKRLLPNEKYRWFVEDTFKPSAGAFLVVWLLDSMIRPDEQMSRVDWGLYLFGNGIVAFLVTLILLNQIWPSVQNWISKTFARYVL